MSAVYLLLDDIGDQARVVGLRDLNQVVRAVVQKPPSDVFADVFFSAGSPQERWTFTKAMSTSPEI